MPTPFSGGCACRAVRYKCTTEPLISLKCHCRDCQRASGSAFAPMLYVAAATLTSTGELKYYAVKGESGRPFSRGFCPQCGSPVLAKPAGPELIGIWAASLDDPRWVEPTMEIWTGSAQPWDYLTPHLPRYKQQLTAGEIEVLLAARS
jgi:hypothetical protein